MTMNNISWVTVVTSNEDYMGFWTRVNTTTTNDGVNEFFGNTTDPSHQFGGPSRRWVLLSLLVIPVWILGGNLIVLLAVLYQRNLQNLSNMVIASLAFTDLLLGLVVVPLSIYQLVHGEWVLGFPVCLIWTGSDVILSTASIMHLCAIALYRYHGIAHPLHVRRYGTQGRHVTMLVVPAWSVAVALSIPFIVQAILDRTPVMQTLEVSDVEFQPSEYFQCGIFNQTFAIYSSLVSFFIPLTVMIFADIRSIQILRKNIKRPMLLDYAYVQSQQRLAGTSPTETIGGDDVTDGSVHVTATSRQLLPTITVTTPHDVIGGGGGGTNFEGRPNGTCAEAALLNCGSPPGTASSDTELVSTGRTRSRSMVYIEMLASCGKTKVNGRERRAEKTLIWVFASFVVLWLPFFCTNLAYGLCGDRCSIPGELFQVFAWLGYLSSGVNPCIYTFLNRDFRTAFRNLLLCRHEKLTRTAHSFGLVSTSNGTLRGHITS